MAVIIKDKRRVYVQWREPDGKTRHRTIYGITESEFEELLADAVERQSDSSSAKDSNADQAA